MTYIQALDFLGSFVNLEKVPAWKYRGSLKLDRFKGFLSSIGNPERALKCVHVAGTKGKGSTCAFIAYILREAGYSVGFYTSPHLCDFRERIRILRPGGNRTDLFEGMIRNDELCRLVDGYKDAIRRYNKNSVYGPLTFFEIYTALAFVYFREKNVDIAVLETGMGGRLDATNVITPLACAISPISYEHTDKLGKTLEAIAGEKAGIIKKGIEVISAPQDPRVMKVLLEKCRKQGSKLSVRGKIKGLKVRLVGEHQLVNASVAVGVVKALSDSGINVKRAAIKMGLYNTVWPARCEVLSVKPMVVLDGAQNAASAMALKKAVKRNFRYRRLLMVLGISSDKDIKGICSSLKGLADTVILTRADTPRAQDPRLIAKYFKDERLFITEGVKESRRLALSEAGPRDLVLVCGSLFVAGEFRHDALKQ